MKISRFLKVALLVFCSITSDIYAKWFDDFYPYRLEINLENNSSGAIDIQITTDEIIKQIHAVSPDIVDIDNFAFEKVVLVDPLSQKSVGGFKIFLDSDNLIIDSNFSLLGKSGGAWYGFIPSEMKFVEAETENETIAAIMVKKEAITNSKLSQSINLNLDTFYLLDYWLYNNLFDNCISVQLEDPAKRLFVGLPSSYIPQMTAIKCWTHCKSLVRATVPKANLNITTAYIGEAGVGQPSLQKATWKLLADLPTKSSKLHLYYVPRAGHKMTIPSEQMVVKSTASYKEVDIISAKAEALNPNPDGIIFKGKSLTAWTIPSYFPLNANYLKTAMPEDYKGSKPLQVRLFKGGDTTVLVAIQTNTPYAQFSDLDCNMPAQIRFERLAPISVYDGPFPSGKLIETRLDAIMSPNDPLVPSSDNGIHVLAATFTASKQTQSGNFTGLLKFSVQTQVPNSETVEIPIELKILPVTINPMNHFGAIFGGETLLVRNSDPETFTGPGLSVADFHGFPYDARKTDWVTKLPAITQEELTNNPVSKLFRNYFHKMLDFDIQPSFIPCYTDYDYKVIEQEGNNAPIISDWDFDEYDKAIDEFLVDREMPWLPIWHTNGHIMNTFRLNNGITYSLDPNPSNKLWKQLPEQEYLSLWGNYFDALGQHLDEKGYLDKAMLLIDESQPSTYDIMLKIRREFKKHKYSSRIKIMHTIQQTSAYTTQKDGSLITDEVLDITMPSNDEQLNFFEPAFNQNFKEPKNHWVYYVETDHLNLTNAGISTIITPLKLKQFGANGWYCWASFLWSMPYPVGNDDGWEFTTGPVVNPWLNPFYHHGPGVLSFFYPPDPRGVASKPTVKITPSYRLSLMRDGIQARALLEILSDGKDDIGQNINVNKIKLNQAKKELEKLLANNPVQWYTSYGSYRNFYNLLFESIEE